MGFSGGGSFSHALGCRRAWVGAIATAGGVLYVDPDTCGSAQPSWVAIGQGELVDGRLTLRDEIAQAAACEPLPQEPSVRADESMTCTTYSACTTSPGPTASIAGHVWPRDGNLAVRDFFVGLDRLSLHRRPPILWAPRTSRPGLLLRVEHRHTPLRQTARSVPDALTEMSSMGSDEDGPGAAAPVSPSKNHTSPPCNPRSRPPHALRPQRPQPAHGKTRLCGPAHVLPREGEQRAPSVAACSCCRAGPRRRSHRPAAAWRRHG